MSGLRGLPSTPSYIPTLKGLSLTFLFVVPVRACSQSMSRYIFLVGTPFTATCLLSNDSKIENGAVVVTTK